jgi:hypothetical protein
MSSIMLALGVGVWPEDMSLNRLHRACIEERATCRTSSGAVPTSLFEADRLREARQSCINSTGREILKYALDKFRVRLVYPQRL